jgi:hypothetical protein
MISKPRLVSLSPCQANELLDSYGDSFNQFGSFGYCYFFVDIIRKFLDCFVLAFMRGSTQSKCLAVVHVLANVIFACE